MEEPKQKAKFDIEYKQILSEEDSMLTLKKLEAMEPGLFAQGLLIDSPEGINLANTGKEIMWVANRAFLPFWSIYTQDPHKPEALDSFEKVWRFGNKIKFEFHIQKLIQCDHEAFKRYRF